MAVVGILFVPCSLRSAPQVEKVSTAATGTARRTAPSLRSRKLILIVRKNPQSLKARFLLARSLIKDAQYEKALQILTWILQRKRVPTILFHLGLVQAKLGRLDRAIPLWLEIVQAADGQPIKKPLSLATFTYLGLALNAQGSHVLALEWFERALKVNPGYLKARLYAGVQHFKLAKSLEKDGMPIDVVREAYGKAAEQWLLLLKAQPERPVELKTLAFLGQAMSERGDAQRARLTFDRMLQLDPENSIAKKALSKLNVNEPVGPVDPPVGPPIPAAGVPYEPFVEGPMDDLEAEEHFLEGLEHKDEGRWDKALYSFIQAIELMPKFIPVYLQLGEVYTQLARLAPTKDQFQERLTLALQSYEKVLYLAPGTLNDTAARGQIIEVKKLAAAGFYPFHLDLGRAAVREDRTRDAFDEYMLLLSNQHMDVDILYDLADVLPHLEAGQLQDLQFFLEDAVHQNPEVGPVHYVLGHTYRLVGKTDLARTTLEAYREYLVRFSRDEAPVAQLIIRAVRSTRFTEDLYLLGAYFFSRNDFTDAREQLTAYRDATNPGDLFHDPCQEKLVQVLRQDSSTQQDFSGELKEVTSAIPKVDPLFGEFLDPANASAEIQDSLERFLKDRPQNGVARLALVWVLKIRGEKLGASEGEALKEESQARSLELLREKVRDPEWHFEAGRRALVWRLNDTGRSHFKVAGDILLSFNRYESRSFGQRALSLTRDLIDRGFLVQAGIALDYAHIFNPDDMDFYLARFNLDAKTGKGIMSIGNLVQWGLEAFSHPWHRMIFLADLGVILSLALLLAVFGTSATLVLKHFDTFHHLAQEYGTRITSARATGEKLILTFPIFIGIVGLVAFPTGFILFFPLIAWPHLNRIERFVYSTLVAALILVPAVLTPAPISRLDTLKLIQDVRVGVFSDAERAFASRLEKNQDSFVSRYMLGLIALRSGRDEIARGHFAKLYESHSDDPGVLVNLAVLESRAGRHRIATTHLNTALGKDHINVPALFDLYVIMRNTGDQEKADNYLKWATQASDDPERMKRYKSLFSDLPGMVLMDHPLPAAHVNMLFSLWSSGDFLLLLKSLSWVVLWFVGCGGLAGYLIFLRERISFPPSPPPVDDPKVRHARAELTRRKALGANLVLPGSGLYFAGLPHGGAFIQVAFLLCTVIYVSNGGWISNAVFLPSQEGIYSVILWSFLLMAAGIYFLSLVALYQVQNDLNDQA